MTARTMIAVDSALLARVRGEIGEEGSIERFVDFAVELALEHCGAPRVPGESRPHEDLKGASRDQP